MVLPETLADDLTPIRCPMSIKETLNLGGDDKDDDNKSCFRCPKFLVHSVQPSIR